MYRFTGNGLGGAPYSGLSFSSWCYIHFKYTQMAHKYQPDFNISQLNDKSLHLLDTAIAYLESRSSLEPRT